MDLRSLTGYIAYPDLITDVNTTDVFFRDSETYLHPETGWPPKPANPFRRRVRQLYCEKTGIYQNPLLLTCRCPLSPEYHSMNRSLKKARLFLLFPFEIGFNWRSGDTRCLCVHSSV